MKMKNVLLPSNQDYCYWEGFWDFFGLLLKYSFLKGYGFLERSELWILESIVQKLTFEKSDGIFEMERKEGWGAFLTIRKPL